MRTKPRTPQLDVPLANVLVREPVEVNDPQRARDANVVVAAGFQDLESVVKSGFCVAVVRQLRARMVGVNYNVLPAVEPNLRTQRTVNRKQRHH